MVWQKSEIGSSYEHFIQVGYPEMTSVVLSKAGLTTKEQAEEFLHGDEIYNPNRIKNIEAATDIIWRHIYKRSRICVFGDYDADGVTGAAILYLGLRKLGANVVVRLPDRIREGYGISMKAVEEQITLGVKLFVTIDNGIRAHAETELIKACGCDIVILDHHQPEETIPSADAVIDLHISGETYPFCELTGSGLAWKIVHYMLEQAGEHDYAMSLVDLAAIGTIGDVAPLVGENRVIVRRGLRRIRCLAYDRPGIRGLLSCPERATAEDIAFRVAPCINASGRLNPRGAELALILALESDERMAQKLIAHISEINERRKKLQTDCYREIRKLAEERISRGDKILVLFAQSAPSGIAGLLAGNLKEEFNRPAIVFSEKQNTDGVTIWTGSGRSVECFHMLDALTECADSMLHFGGHKLAAGMSIEASYDKLEELRIRMNEQATGISEDDLRPVLFWDMELDENGMTSELYAELETLEPFGAGVPKPIFRMTVHTSEHDGKSHSVMGAGGEHLKLYCDSYSAIGFSLADKYIKAQLPNELEAVGYLSENYFNGQIYRQFSLLDFEPVSVCCKLTPTRRINERGDEYGG